MQGKNKKNIQRDIAMPTFTCAHCGKKRTISHASFAANKLCNECYNERLRDYLAVHKKETEAKVFGWDSVRKYRKRNNCIAISKSEKGLLH